MPKIILFLAVLAIMCTQGCSQRAWYEGARQSHINECYKAPPAAREECLRAVDKDSYDEYQRKRREEMQK
jgi:hypothetical protein